MCGEVGWLVSCVENVLIMIIIQFAWLCLFCCRFLSLKCIHIPSLSNISQVNNNYAFLNALECKPRRGEGVHLSVSA